MSSSPIARDSLGGGTASGSAGSFKAVETAQKRSSSGTFITLNVTVDAGSSGGNTGALDISGEVTLSISESEDLLTDVADTLGLSPDPEKVAEQASEHTVIVEPGTSAINNIESRIQSLVSSPPGGLSASDLTDAPQPSSVDLSGITGIRRETVTHSNIRDGSDTDSFSFSSLSYPVITLPGTGAVLNEIENMPSIPITIRVEGPLTEGRLDQLLGNDPRATVDVPPSIFFSVREADCASQFPSIANTIEDLQSETSQLRERINVSAPTESDVSSIRDTLESVTSQRRQLSRDISDSGCLDSFRSDLKRLERNLRDLLPTDCFNQFTTIGRRVRSYEDAVDRARQLAQDPNTTDLQGVIDEVSGDLSGLPGPGRSSSTQDDLVETGRQLRADITSEVDGPCATEFREIVEAKISQAGGLDSLLEGSLEDAAGSCIENYPRADEIVSRFESQAEELRNQETRRSTIRNAENLLDQSNDFVNDMRRAVGGDAQCRLEFRSRLDSARSTLESIQSRQPNIVTCSDKHPDIERRVSRLEDQLIQSRGNVTDQLATQIAAESNDLQNTIESQVSGDDKCLREYVDRTEAAVTRAQRSGGSLRIDIIKGEEDLGFGVGSIDVDTSPEELEGSSLEDISKSLQSIRDRLSTRSEPDSTDEEV